MQGNNAPRLWALWRTKWTERGSAKTSELASWVFMPIVWRTITMAYESKILKYQGTNVALDPSFHGNLWGATCWRRKDGVMWQDKTPGSVRIFQTYKYSLGQKASLVTIMNSSWVIPRDSASTCRSKVIICWCLRLWSSSGAVGSVREFAWDRKLSSNETRSIARKPRNILWASMAWWYGSEKGYTALAIDA